MGDPETLTTFVHKTQEEDKENKSTTQKTAQKKMSNTKNWG